MIVFPMIHHLVKQVMWPMSSKTHASNFRYQYSVLQYRIRHNIWNIWYARPAVPFIWRTCWIWWTEMLPQNSFHEILPNSILHMMMILQKSVKNGNNLYQPMRMSWMNPWAFCPLLISAVGILLTTEVPSVNQYSYLPLNNPLVIY